MDWKKFFENLPWKSLLLELYKGVLRPFIAKMVASSDQKWDDALFEAADLIAEKLLGELKEKSRDDLVSEAKALEHV